MDRYRFLIDKKSMQEAFLAISKKYDMSVLVNRAIHIMRTNIRAEFDAQQDPYGNPWEPLKDATLELRRRKGNSSTTILQDTHKMLRSLKRSQDRSNQGFIQMDFPAPYHQYGDPGHLFFNRPSNLPQRKIFPLDDSGDINMPPAWQKEIEEMLEFWAGE